MLTLLLIVFVAGSYFVATPVVWSIWTFNKSKVQLSLLCGENFGKNNTQLFLLSFPVRESQEKRPFENVFFSIQFEGLVWMLRVTMRRKMKYVPPKYERAFIKTKDVLTASTNRFEIK